MSKFCAFILTHGRPDNVITYDTLRRQGYTGDIRLIIDNEDARGDEYRQRYGAEVIEFNKQQVSDTMDEGDNFGDRRTIVYARNVCWRIAKEHGYTAFIQLDDDYTEFRHKVGSRGQYIEGIPGQSVCQIRNLDAVFAAMTEFVRTTRFKTICMGQGGDYLGGMDGDIWRKPKRKAMNSFVCLTDRPFQFVGRVNEDVSTYALLGSRGDLFLTHMHIALQQAQTQKNSGGMSEMYLDSGTYVKSFYSVMFNPSGVRISIIQSKYPRIHHQVRWRYTTPKILSVKSRKEELPKH